MSPSRTPRGAVLGLTVGALVAGGLAFAPAASAASTTIVINEVYGGGGNSGATLKNDFIELKNVGATPVDLSTWSVQYAASGANSAWSGKTLLSGVIAPGATYLIQEAAGNGGTTVLPTPDATGTIAMSGTAAKVALVSTTSTLTCAASCAGTPGVVDLIGYGTTAVGGEGEPTPNLSNTTSASRTSAPDTDNNASDFTVGAPSPLNSTNQGPPAPPPPPSSPATIPAVQGAAHTSPMNGQTVETTGVVTARTSNGFWFQDPQGDGDAATSDGLFVFTSTAPSDVAATGAAVTVIGTVGEFRSSTRPDDLTVTQLSSFTVTAAAPLAPVTPTVVGPGGLVRPGTVIDDDNMTAFEPATDGIDFYESLEGMQLSLEAPEAVGPTNEFGELPVVVEDASVRTPRGGIVLRDTDGLVDGDSGDYVTGDFNPERIILDDRVIGDGRMPEVNVGAVLAGTVLGVLDYGFGNPKLQVNTVPGVASNSLEREQTSAPGSEELAVATFNVENLDPTDPQEKFDDLAELIVNNLQAPDLIALEEIQDNNGAARGGVVAADETLTKLVDAISTAGGPAYDFRQIDPQDLQDGGEPGGNIRVGFLFRTDRGLAFVDRQPGDATTATGVTGTGDATALTHSPGRVDPTNAAWTNSRKPLAGAVTYRGETYFVVVNHFASKGGDQPLYGEDQPPVRSSEVQRHQQAAVVGNFLGQIMAADADANVIALGDINDFQFSHTMRILENASGLKNLMETLPVAEQYSYVFDGNSQSLDHTLVSPALLAGGLTYDPVHVNAEFADQVSDHDPQVTRIDTAAEAAAAISDADPRRGDTVTVTGTGFATGTTVKATFPSERGTVLGTGVADASGTVTITFTVPDLVHKGSYQVDLTAADGEKASTSFTLRTRGQDVADRAHERNNGGD